MTQKKLGSVSALSLVTLLGTGLVANAQNDREDRRRRDDDQRNERQISQQQRKMARQRADAEARRVREEQ